MNQSYQRQAIGSWSMALLLWIGCFVSSIGSAAAVTPPTITPPANIAIAAVDNYGTPVSDPYIAAFLNGATAFDLVDGYVQVSPYNAPMQFPVGITNVIFNATDAAGNVGIASASITVLPVGIVSGVTPHRLRLEAFIPLPSSLMVRWCRGMGAGKLPSPLV